MIHCGLEHNFRLPGNEDNHHSNRIHPGGLAKSSNTAVCGDSEVFWRRSDTEAAATEPRSDANLWGAGMAGAPPEAGSHRLHQCSSFGIDGALTLL